MNKGNLLQKYGIGAVLASGSLPAFAVLDVSAVLTGIGEAVVAVTSIGVAVLGVVVLIAAFRWVKRAI